VSLNNFDYVVPPKIAEKPELKARFDGLMQHLSQEYEVLQKDVPTEDARAVLPNACTTKIMVTMNARELRHFFKLRCHKSAQSEIRELAFKMFELVREAAPIFFADLDFEK
jgi:thymidylate synthase (FAD)